MERRTFIKRGCMTCLGLAAGLPLLDSCTPVRYMSGELMNDGLRVPLSSFAQGKKTTGRYIILRNDALQYPICVYRISDTEYTALFMRCTHQGAELQVAGDRLTCPAHGSEFDQKGKVRQGPAGNPLRSFPVRTDGDFLWIDLRRTS